MLMTEFNGRFRSACCKVLSILLMFEIFYKIYQKSWKKKKTALPMQGHWEIGLQGFPDGTNSKESACSVGDPGLIPGSGRSSGEGDGYPPQYSCLENPMDRGAW